MSVISAGLLQMDPSQFQTVRDYQVSVAARISSLVRKGAEFVVLPEFAAMIGASLEYSPSDAPDIAELSRAVGRAGFDRAMDFFAAVALANHIHLCPGTFLVSRTDGFANLAPILSPSGDLVAVQGQTHVSEREHGLRFLCSTDLTIVDVRGHRIGFAVGTDAWYPEVSRILALMGADTIVAPTAVPAPYTVWHQTRGLWQAVQQNQVFGIEVCLGGSWLGRTYQGRSRVFAPVEVTPEGRGILSEVASGSIWGELVLALDTSRLDAARRAFPVFDHLNTEMYERSLPDAYLVARSVRVAPERR
ncbi:MAG: carbon-nitrogen hydrolase family protein [Firmicutes bacterium]|nr:carbon-nitrogen hydrolase family protein [Bacillota bacterium]